MTAKQNISSRRLRLLRLFLDVVLNGKFTREAFKLYVSDRWITIRGVCEKLQKQGKGWGKSAIQTIIWRDKERLEQVFGEKILVDILEYTDTNLDNYEKRLVEAMVKYSNNSGLLCGSIVLKFPEPEMATELTDEDFTDFLQTIKPYLKLHMKYITENLDEKAVGYCKYIIASNVLSGVDLERKKYLMMLLEGENNGTD
ncbi:MAG TPA: hypothetical protein DCP90_08115 [Clostridiales bacterium]|nr:MAG: hypothetical protein A2Y22_00115 [Clostridiales bacterium GWD2_32_59]HAN10556.1 hypothetical protein [Clostridiales bacterium]